MSKYIRFICTILLIASTMTAITVALLFNGDSIALGRAVVIFAIVYIVFFGSIAYLYRESRKEITGENKKM